VAKKAQFLIQIEQGPGKLTMASARAILEPKGIEIDRSYGPVLVNPYWGSRSNGAESNELLKPDKLQKLRA
jgi:hypothetical protein